MQKVLSLVALVGCLSSSLIAAPTYYTVTHATPGNTTPNTQFVGTQNVTVTAINPVIFGTPQSPCGTGPYLIGANKSNGFNYAFQNGATHVRVKMVRLHQEDTIRFTMNGNPFVLAAGNLSAYTGTCGATNNAVITNLGELSGSQLTGVGDGAQIDLQLTPNIINNISIEHVSNTQAGGGVAYSFEFANDSCEMTPTITQNFPCAGRKLILEASNFPGATYTWTGPLGFNPNPSGPTVVRDPISVTQWGDYSVIINWGSCVLYDTIFIDVQNKLTPAAPTISIPPNSALVDSEIVCRNEDATFFSAAQCAGGCNYFWYGKILPVTQTQTLTVPNVQPADTGFYYTYVYTQEGCYSDTSRVYLGLKPDVVTNFTYDIRQGCDFDTLIFQNFTIGDSVSFFYINPVYNGVAKDSLVATYVPPSPFPIPGGVTHTFYIPRTNPTLGTHSRDTIPDTMDLKIASFNGRCWDSVTLRVVNFHPVRALFEVSDDTICQNTLVDFFNKSFSPPGPTQAYVWNFKELGDTLMTYNAQHTYTITGVYEPTLTVTDFLGCKDSAKITMFIDSTGAIFYNVSDSVVCEGDVIHFEGDFSRVGNLSTAWDFGDGSFVADTPKTLHAFDRPGTYPVRFTAFNRVCPDTFTIREMIVKPYPKIDLGEDTTMCPNGSPIVLRDILNLANPNATWRWNTPEIGENGPSITVYHPGTYAATVELDGCATTDSVTVFKKCYVNIPNAFTPNGDGNGDYFLPRQFLSSGVTKFKMSIYNRWGQVIFETASIDGRGWDGMFNGEPQPMGVYVYVLDVTFENKISEHYVGNVTLLR